MVRIYDCIFHLMSSSLFLLSCKSYTNFFWKKINENLSFIVHFCLGKNSFSFNTF